MTCILFWSEGRGSGHVKRINAIAASLMHHEETEKWKYFALIPRVLNKEYLKSYVEAVNSLEEVPQEPLFTVVDQRPSEIPLQVIEKSNLLIQPCRLNSEISVSSNISKKLIQIKIEDFESGVDMVWGGAVLDVDESNFMSEREVRLCLESDLKNNLDSISGKKVLVHVNTSEKDLAEMLVHKALKKVGISDFVLVSSVHSLYIQSCKNVWQRNIKDIVNYYSYFDELHVPAGYNTYYESQLYFKGVVHYYPLMDFDQPLRVFSMPKVERFHKAEIGRVILREISL